MHKNLQQPLIVLFLAFSCIFLLSFNGSHPTGGGGRTGAPGDGLCLDCHTNVSSSIDGSVSISGIPALVEAGVTYNVSITSEYTSGTAIAAGFQVVALLDSDDSNAGTWTNPTGNSSINSGGGRTYFGHQPATNFGAATSITWTADWTAPAVTSNDDITFYATTALVNDNNNNAGDKIKFSTLTTSIEFVVEPLICNIDLNDEPACFGDATGSATIVAEGGDGNYSYEWPDGTMTATNSMLEAGVQVVTVTDGLGTSNICEFILSEPMELVLNVITTNALCFDSNLGTADANVVGGTGSYTYNWSNGETGSFITGLVAMNYAVTVTDANGCDVFTEFDITGPDLALEVNVVSAVDASCVEISDGSITVVATGGTPGYNYFWPFNNTNGPTISELDAGTYTVEVTDDNDCLMIFQVEISTGSGLEFMIESITSAGCTGQNTGAATVSASNGTGDYVYHWSNGGTGETQEDLAAGLYTVTITDLSGCTIVGEVDISAIDNEAPTLSQTSFNVLLDENGMSSFSADNISLVAFDNCGVETIEVELPVLSCATLGESNIDVVLTDVNMNSVTIPIIINTVDSLAPEMTCPDSIVSNTCTEIVYDMPIASDNCGVESLELVEGFASGTVFPVGVTNVVYMATDSSGNESTCSFTVEVIADLAITSSITNVNCFGGMDGEVLVSISGGTEPYTMSPSGAELVNLSAGDYIITVMDDNGCSVMENITITEPEEMNVDITITDVSCFNYIDGSVSLDIGGGIPPYEINFMNGLDYSMLEAGEYNYSVVDSMGCEISGSIEISQPSALIISDHTIVDATGSDVADGAIKINVNGGTGAYTYMWTQDGVAYSDSMDVINALPGVYICTVTDENGCIFISEEWIIDFNSSLNTYDISHNMELYPNPSSGSFFIGVGEKSTGLAKITIYNAQGIEVIEKNIDISNNLENISLNDDLGAGVYLLKIDVDGKSGVKKLMIIK